MTNLALDLREAAQMYPGRPAVRLDDTIISYAQLDELSARVAGWLRERGLRPGDPVGVMLPNVPQFPVIYYGVLRAGGAVVPMNPLLKYREVTHYLGDSGARLVIAWETAASEAQAGAEAAGASAVIIGGSSFDSVSEWPLSPDVARRADDDTAVILYTSGTTGTPKGAELTHVNMRRNASVTATTLLALGPDDVVMGCLPLFHSFGQTCGLNAAVLSGACLTLISRFSAAQALRVIERDRVTVFEGVPTMYVGLLHEAAGAPDDVHAAVVRLRRRGAAGRGAARVRGGVRDGDPRGLRAVGDLAGRHVQPQRPAAQARLDRAARSRAWSCGWSTRTGDEVPAGEIGEIAIRGHNVMKGYWRRPEATAAAISGRLVPHRRHGAGPTRTASIYIVDRKKDMIIRGGYNVYPREVEEVLYEHPAVLEAAVIGVPHASLGEEVAAAVVLRPGAAATPEELRDYVRQRVAAYKYPRQVWLVDALPKGPDRQDPQARDHSPACSRKRRTGHERRLRCRSGARRGRRRWTWLLTQAALGPARRFFPGRSALRFAWALAGQPGLAASRAGGLAAELARVAGGSSAVAPGARDRRFADPAWSGNPVLRRVMQAYLATGARRSAWSRTCRLTGATRSGCGSRSSNLIEALAPSNNPLLSPEAWKAAIDSGGGSLVAGTRNLVSDLSSAPRVPSMVAAGRLHGRRRPGGDAGLGGAAHPGVRADPVPAADRDGPPGTAADRAARRSTSTTSSTSRPGAA